MRSDFVYGFSHSYTHSDILHAELQAIIDGLIYSHALGLSNVIIETNSEIAAQMIQKIQPAQWSCMYLLRQIWSMDDAYQGVSWIVWEQNKVADAFAKLVHTPPIRTEFHRLQDISINIRRFTFYVGIPFFIRLVLRGVCFPYPGQQGFLMRPVDSL